VGGTDGNGAEFYGGATVGNGLYCHGQTAGRGIYALGAGTSEGIGAKGGATNAPGLQATGDGSGDGAVFKCGAGAGTGDGLTLSGGGTGGIGLRIQATANDDAGVVITGNGSGHGLSVTGGTTGHGIYAYGGATSGDGIYAAGQTLGHGMTLVYAGAGRYDLNADIHGTLDTVTTAGTCTTLTNWHASVTGWTDGGRLDLILDAILVDTNSLNDTKIPDTLSLANINAQVVDCLSTDTYAEAAQGAPAATASLAAKLGFLYKNFRNKKTQTSTTWNLYDDAGTTVDHKATVSDDGVTFTKGEIGTGP